VNKETWDGVSLFCLSRHEGTRRERKRKKERGSEGEGKSEGQIKRERKPRLILSFCSSSPLSPLTPWHLKGPTANQTNARGSARSISEVALATPIYCSAGVVEGIGYPRCKLGGVFGDNVVNRSMSTRGLNFGAFQLFIKDSNEQPP
jgi:hypothetical protein